MTATLDHPTAAKSFVAENERMQWHDMALWFVRNKRDRQSTTLPEWEYLRELASEIKAHTQAHLADYLEQFERAATAQGAVVHWASDAQEHNEIVLKILRDHDVQHVVKSKSMLTEECHLNPHLEAAGIEVVDSDLGERIIQMRGEPPSHIVLPAIHLKKEDVGDTFHEHLGTDAGASDPQYLTEAARQHLRDRFLNAQAGITGVNFAVAETGAIVVCTNEGNADLGSSLPPIHIACMGIEKLIARQADLGVFTRLLARSATGQPITTYTSHYQGPKPGGQLHIVLVDNGRTDIRGHDEFREALNCIRCGACMNTCPVYRRSGGHSYGAVVPGPIGSVLSPAADTKEHKSLPFACTLCGSCTDVCPVKIPLHHQLLAWRQEIGSRGLLPRSKRAGMQAASFLFGHPRLFAAVGSIARKALRWLPKSLTHSRLNAWAIERDLPPPPSQSFRQWYQKNRASSVQLPVVTPDPVAAQAPAAAPESPAKQSTPAAPETPSHVS